MLPVVPLPTTTIDVDGTSIVVRGLSRSEHMGLAAFSGDSDGGEEHLLAAGAGVTVEEAKAWRATTPTYVVGVVVDAILALSALDEGAEKSGAASDSSR